MNAPVQKDKFILVPLYTLAGIVAVMTLYFLAIRPRLSGGTIFVIELAVLLSLCLLAVGSLLFSAISLLGWLFTDEKTKMFGRLKGQMTIFIAVLLLLVIFVGASQWMAHTPAILDGNGKPVPESIASLERIKLGGVDQWLVIRGQDVSKPVLLFLSGGPGASEAARVLRFNRELEKHFVVVIWEQRGCGKSYPSHHPKSQLTLEQYTADIIELTESLRERFGPQKIYLAGHSWGTIIGVLAAQARPDLYYAYVGASQMVDVSETDQMIYDIVLEHSLQTGDTDFVQTLETQGKPPYYGKLPIKPYSTLFGREYALFEAANIKNEEYRRDGDILLLMLKQPEYGWLDRIYYLLGLTNTFNVVYPQLQELDFRQDALRFEIPVYLILGRHDMNNPYQIPAEYYDLLSAPNKELVFFEESGHGMIWEEADLFTELMVNTILPETYQP